MADGTMKLSPAEARAKAEEMKKNADEIQDLLNDIIGAFDEIDNTDTGTYQGSKNAVQLRGNLDEFSRFFPSVYEQITKSANDIITITTTSEEE